jgi:glutathione synthase/RimK-type ligase-like ATP-grasp enzyme
MSKVHILLYDKNDSGGNALKAKMGLKRILKTGSEYQASPDKVIINWGNSRMLSHCKGSQFINHPDAVSISVDKIKAFKAMEGKCRHVPFTTNRLEALKWLGIGHKVVCRDVVNGSEGSGIRIIEATAPNLTVQSDPGFMATLMAWFTSPSAESNLGLLGHSPLYTQFVPFKKEYRVHVVNGKAVNVRRKVTSVDQPTVVGDFKNVTIYHQDIVDQAVKATKAVGLDFAGVDVLWDGAKAWVLETNTAPSIGGTLTVQGYADELKKMIKEKYNITC